MQFVSLANFQIFKFCCDIKGSYLIGSLWVSLIIDQSECMVCFSLCTELTLFCTESTLFCTELPENRIYLNQSELSNFSMYIIRCQTRDCKVSTLLLMPILCSFGFSMEKIQWRGIIGNQFYSSANLRLFVLTNYVISWSSDITFPPKSAFHGEIEEDCSR